MTVNEKIAKWLGWKIFYEDWDTEQEFPMFIPSGKPKRTHMIDAIRVPDFQNDFNACLKWAVPKLDSFPITYLVYYNGKREWLITLDDGENYFSDESISEAFTDALIKVIDSE